MVLMVMHQIRWKSALQRWSANAVVTVAAIMRALLHPLLRQRTFMT